MEENERKEIKLSLLVDDMNIYQEKSAGLNSEHCFCFIVGYKIDLQKPIAFFHIKIIQSENAISIVTKITQYLWVLT